MATMTNYGFFDWQSTDTGEEYLYSAAEFGTIISAIAANGVNYKYGDKLAMTGSGLTVSIGSGSVWVNGHYGWNDAATTLTLSPATSATRKDYICAHLNESARNIEIVQVEGTTADYPTVSSDYVVLYKADITTSNVTLTDARSYNYGSSNLPAAMVIFSDTEPTCVEGAVWLKPVGE